MYALEKRIGRGGREVVILSDLGQAGLSIPSLNKDWRREDGKAVVKRDSLRWVLSGLHYATAGFLRHKQI